MITDIIELILLPPNIFFIILFSIFFIKHNKKFRIYISITLVAFYIFTTPILSKILIMPLTYGISNNFKAQAIVVLGAGIAYKNGKFYLPFEAQIRLDRAYELYKHKKLPILLSGGRTNNLTDISEAQLMQDYLLEKNNLIDIRWLEQNSFNTRQQSKLVWQILHKEKIRQIILVTNDYHIKRSVNSFTDVGFLVKPVFAKYISDAQGLSNLLPNYKSMLDNRKILREFYAIVWYEFLNLINY